MKTRHQTIALAALLGGCVYLCAACAGIIGVDEPTLDPAAVLPAGDGTDASGGTDGSSGGLADSSRVDSTTNVTPPVLCGGATCAAGMTCCANACVDTTSDVSNCGACGKSCTSTLANANGQACSATLGCTFTTCKNFFFDKDKNRQNGCEATCGDNDGLCCPAGPRCKGASYQCDGSGICVD